jgi:lactoylglutathione lyase
VSDQEVDGLVLSAFPIISTPDLQRSLAFYRDLMEGVVAYRFPAEGEPDYVGIDLGSSHLGIGRDRAAADAVDPQRFSLWVYVDDCDAAVQRLRAGGVEVVDEPADQPWGERVAKVLDPDGNSVVIGAAPD